MHTQNSSNNKEIIYTEQNLVWRDYSKHMHTHTDTHRHLQTNKMTIHDLSYSQHKQITGTSGAGRQQCWVENRAGLLFWGKKCLEVRIERVLRGFLSERSKQGDGFFWQNSFL